MRSKKYILILSALFIVVVASFQNCGKDSNSSAISASSDNDSLDLDDDDTPTDPTTVDPTPHPDPTVTEREVQWQPVSGRSSLKVSQNGQRLEKNDGSKQEARSVYANFAADTGKYFLEIRILNIISGNRQRVGVVSESGRVPDGSPTGDASYGIDFDGSYSINAQGKYTNDKLLSAPLKMGDVVGIYLNADGKKVVFYVNGLKVKTQALEAGHKYAPFFWGNKDQNAVIFANFGKTKFIYGISEAGLEPMDNTGASDRVIVGWNKTASAAKYIAIATNKLTVTKDDGTAKASAVAYGETNVDSGKWYMEYDVLQIISGDRQRLGMVSTVGRVPLNGATGEPSYGYDFNGTLSIHDAKFISEAGGVAIKVGNTVGVAIDLTGATISFYVNGKLQKTRAIKKGAWKYSPMFMGSNDSNGQVRANFGFTPFRYAAPAGYSAFGL